MRAAVVVGTGPWQRPLVTFLRLKGHEVLTLGPGGNIDVDARDIYAAHARMRTLEIDPEMIVTDQSDPCYPASLILSSRYCLPANPIESMCWYSCWDKVSMYDRASALDIPVPEYKVIREADEMTWDRMIVKPADANDSKGFFDLTDLTPENRQFCWEESQEYSRSKTVIGQRLVEGTWIVIDAICGGDDFRITGTADVETHERGCWHVGTFPSAHDLSVPCRQLETYVRSSGLKFGIIHSEWIRDKDGKCWLMEVACRGAGFNISPMADGWVSGIDIYETMYQAWSGKKVVLPKATRGKAACVACHWIGKKIDEKAAMSDLVKVPNFNKLILIPNNRRRDACSIHLGTERKSVRESVDRVKEVLMR